MRMGRECYDVRECAAGGATGRAPAGEVREGAAGLAWGLPPFTVPVVRHWEKDMNHLHATCGALLASTLLGGSVHAEVVELELGQFYFRGTFETIYQGDFEEYLVVTTEGPYDRFVSECHLGRLVEDFELGPIVWVQITGPDTETSQVNPGADIDLFATSSLPAGVLAQYEYVGPNPLYHNATSESLAAEVAAVDFVMGDVDEDDSFVSLGTAGHLFMWFEGGSPEGGGDVDEGVIDVTGDLQPSDGRIWELSLSAQAPIAGITDWNTWLRLHEVAPISEWVTVTIGYLEASEQTEGDLNGDGRVDAADLGLFLAAWGPNPGHPADFDGDGVVGGIDLGLMLLYWTP